MLVGDAVEVFMGVLEGDDVGVFVITGVFV